MAGTPSLEKKLGKPPTFKELFLATHLVKESKKKFWDGLYDESLDGAMFCTNRSRKAYEEYATAMIDRYGEDVTQHPVGDAELWEHTQGGSKFGIVLRILISSLREHLRHLGLRRPTRSTNARKRRFSLIISCLVRDLQSQVEDLHNRVEDVQQKMREEVQHHMREEIQHQVREEMKEEMQRQIAELMKKFGNPGNPTG
ncbi:hypothetical protein R6Q57_024200 [Mikania cordata]